MMIQGKFNFKVQLDDKVYGVFTNKNNSIVDVREIVGTETRKTRHGKTIEVPIFAKTRPQPVIKHPDSIHPTVVDYYHTFYGRNI